jgi:hypothetical protein
MTSAFDIRGKCLATSPVITFTFEYEAKFFEASLVALLLPSMRSTCPLSPITSRIVAVNNPTPPYRSRTCSPFYDSAKKIRD